MIRSANPAMNDRVFTDAARYDSTVETMTVGGTVNKTAILLMLVILTAGFTWRLFFSAATVAEGAAAIMPWFLLGTIGGLVVGIITIFWARRWVMITGPIYALLEGLALGGLSAIMEQSYPGIVIPAVALTFGTLAIMLTIYKTGLIKVTDKFRMGISAAVGAIFLIYLVTFVMGFFGTTIPYIHGSGPIGIGFSILVIGICAFRLLIDFDFIDRGSQIGAPKYMEWYGAFGLIVGLIWLYIEFLRLLSKLRSR